MTIDLYNLNQGDYTKKFLDNADQLLDLYYRFGNKVITHNLGNVPPETKLALFQDAIYATNDEARRVYLENKTNAPSKIADLDVYISNEELMKQMLELKELMQNLVTKTQDATLYPGYKSTPYAP